MLSISSMLGELRENPTPPQGLEDELDELPEPGIGFEIYAGSEYGRFHVCKDRLLTGQGALLAARTFLSLWLRPHVREVDRRRVDVHAGDQPNAIGDLVAPLAASVRLNERAFEPELIA